MRQAAQVFLQSLRIQVQPQGCSHQTYAARAPEIAVGQEELESLR